MPYKTYMTTIVTYYKNYKYLFFTFLGFCIGCFILWNRLLHDRITRDISLYHTDNFLFSILCLIISVFFCLTIYAIINIYKVKYLSKSSNKKFIFQSLLYLKQTRLFYFWSSCLNSPKTFYDFLTKYTTIENCVAYFAEVILYKIILLFAGKSKAFFYIFFVMIPRLFVLIFFYLDIFIYKQFYYFYESLTLLLLPLIFYSLIYITKVLCQKNIAFFMLHIDYKHIDDDYVQITFKKEQPQIEDAFDITNITLLPYIIDLLTLYSNIQNFFIRIEEKEKEIKLYDQLFFYLAFLFGWLGVLYF